MVETVEDVPTTSNLHNGGWERVWGGGVGRGVGSQSMHSFADFNRKLPYVNCVECDYHNVIVFTLCFLSLVLHNNYCLH